MAGGSTGMNCVPAKGYIKKSRNTREMGSIGVIFTFLSLCVLLLMDSSTAQMPGFVSLDCGGTDDFTDELGLEWNPDSQIVSGQVANISVANETRQQYKTLRYFPADHKKYCYSLDVISRTRYLIRATFLYGNFDNSNVYPKFDISFGPTHWTTIVITDADTIEVQELIFLATDPTISVCLSNAPTGQPFISTLELRKFNGSIYLNQFENQFLLSVSARINFGADSDAPVRYPDDPFDRIWQSDSLRKANYLVDVAPGTERISTRLPIDVSSGERPPQKVMQTAVVGRNGSLNYRLNLVGFPGFGWAFTYFAEIEDLDPRDTRKFMLILPGEPTLSQAVVNIQENAHGSYRLYEPGFYNISFPFVLSFRFGKTSDSTLGPLLNAFEINKYLKKSEGSTDGPLLAPVVAAYSSTEWAQEGGDPCLPVPWSWVHCSSDPQPRITSIHLSGKNLTGMIPLGLTKLRGLVELWLDNNSLSGSIPDFSGCPNLKKIHIENNQLTGELPSFLEELPNLKELYVQNNMLSGRVPPGLLNKDLILNFTGNSDLHAYGKGSNHKKLIIGSSVGAAALLIATIISCILLPKGNKTNQNFQHGTSAQNLSSSLEDATADSMCCFKLSDIKESTNNFERNIGSGGFGIVYYGRLKDGKEIAVKVLTNDSYQGKREFANEVSLLSRIHHRQLVQFLGYCQEDERSILVYEYMHNGTLKEHLYGPLTRGRVLKWIKRLEIAEEAAKGIEYLHTGCVPSIIHRDLKTSNILLDKNMKAKVSDFGLSKLAVDGASHVSSVVRGTVGYLDPEYYISQQLTDKSDVYSFGVILLELISGQEAISSESFGANCRNIAQWAKLRIESGDIQSIIDPTLDEYDIQSVWKIAEKALMCIKPHGSMRPSISEVIKEIQDAIVMEKEAEAVRQSSSAETVRHSAKSSLNTGSLDFGVNQPYLSIDDSIARPTAR
ncbi:putative LRR receptor-like serine/threonine-protein kinase At1g67720 [Primulina tabacum]|uniref:putative LRR receptor-like serine/threonine-protein kinase At1g67720 n=1 Tax=Primulina tabacum TaxID=48773 RepID=UPI003F5AB887